jgi:hypothetical protein
MLTLTLGFVVGTLVGWSVPQPAFVKSLVEKVKAKLFK